MILRLPFRVCPLFALILATLSMNAAAQVPAVIRDYQQPMSYGPDYPWEKGNIFRWHTGHAGRYYNCDCEEQKRYSPYIDWYTVCNRDRVRPYGQVVRSDIREVRQRVHRGARRCKDFAADSGFCANCLAENSPSESGGALGKPVLSPSDRSASIREWENQEHVTYGSRLARDRAAEVGSAEADRTGNVRR